MVRSVVTLALIAASGLASAAAATPLAPFIDLQEQGLTLVEDGAGLEAGFPVDLTVDIGGAVRFALLYWAGSERPCTLVGGVCTPTEPFDDQQVIFDGTAITGTIIGTETWATDPAGARLAIGYFADVTSLVAAAGTGSQTFTIGDGDASSNLSDRDGVALVVAFIDAADPAHYRVLVWDGLDFAAGDSITPGDSRVTAPVTFNHGANVIARTAELYIIGGNGAANRPDEVTVSNNPTLFNAFDSSPDGNQWTSDEYTINVPAGVGTTTVQVNSSPAGQNPDELLWEAAALRVQQLDTADPSCSSAVTSSGPPKQVTHTIQDTESGLAEILVTGSENADTVVPPFTVGTTEPVVSTSTKIDQTQPMRIEIRVTDLAGNVTFCGYADARVDVTKDRVPDGAQVFEFTGSGSIGFFQLDDDADPALPATTFFIVELGSYTVTETVVLGYVTSVNCTDPGGNTTANDVTRTATISADAGETVDCLFTNADSGDTTAPSCSPAVANTVPKHVTHTVQDTGSGLAEILVLVSQNADTVVPPFTPGTTNPVDSISTKIDQTQPMSVHLRLTDLAGNSFLCAYADARIDVTKDTVPDAAQDFPFTASGGIGAFSLDDDADPTLPDTIFFIVELGFVTVAEGGAAGYDTTVACIDPFFDTSVDDATRSATISADAAETIECTFTNTATGTDLQVTKTTTATAPGLNETFDYVLTVLNGGPPAATGVQVSDTLPPQLTFVGSDCGAAAVGQVVTWDIGPLAVASSAECRLTVRVVAPGPIANTATVTAAEPDLDPSNNTSTFTIAGGAFIIPTLDWRGLVLLVMAFGALASFFLRR